jgi:rfaE bifunctional protein kinase chain/domain
MKKFFVKKEQIRELFRSFEHLNILVIGDVMVDNYVWGKVSRLSPEAPVPVVSVERKERRLGGAANVALNLQALGVHPILCSVIGVDQEGQHFLDLLRQQKLSQKGILKSRERITTVKTRIIGNHHQLIRIDDEMEEDIGTTETNQLLTLIQYILKHEKIHAVIFEDYNKGLITPRLIQRVVELCRNAGIPVCVDPKKKYFHAYKGVHLFKPNLKELKEGLKLDYTPSIKELQRLISSYRVKQKTDWVMVTLAEQGILINSRKIKEHIPAHVRNIADVSGAGDTVISVAAACRALECNEILTAALSNLAGGIVCEEVGVVPINKQRLLEEALNMDIVR